MNRAVVASALVVLGAAAWAPPAPVVADPPSLRVCFVGNSYTRGNRLTAMVERISESVDGGPRIVGAEEARDAARLSTHWALRRVRRRIASGVFTHVVLQPHSRATLSFPAELVEYARRFDRVADRSGAQVVLYATWAPHPDAPIYGDDRPAVAALQARIDAAFEALARQLDAEVAPVGDAFLRAVQSTEIRVHGPDHRHPTRRGTYLAASVLYASIAGVSPEQATWIPRGVPEPEAREIRRVAAATVGAL